MNKHGTKRPDVSVVVPVYNVEDYLEQCLDSVLTQPGVDLEIVCVDDCGTDRSMEILREYQARDSRIRIVSHAENRGLSAARNTGIENAAGDYIVLLDSDDLLNPDRLALQVDVIRRDQADMVYFHTDLIWDRFPGDPSPPVCSNPPEFVLFNQELHRTNLLDYPALLHATSSWSYIYSADFLRRHGIRYDEHLKRWEDRAFWTRVARLADSVSIVPVSARKYRQRSESITKTTQRPEHLWMMLQQLNIVMDEFESFLQEHPDSDTRTHTKYLHSYIAFRVTGWFLNAVKKMGDEQLQAALIEGAVDLFKRIDWSNVDLNSVRNYTRRLEIDVPRTALLSGMLRSGSVEQIMDFFASDRCSLEDILAAEELFDNAYSIPQERFRKKDYLEFSAESGESAVTPSGPEAWMAGIDLVVHIGFRKTGTTFIQRTLDLNRESLLRHGILFPDSGLDRTDLRGGRSGACAGHLGFVESVRNDQKRAKLWDEVCREIGDRSVNTILVSAENFLHEYQLTDPSQLRKAFAPFRRIAFIVTLRRPDRWMESLYKELVCGGWKGEARTFDDFVREDWEQMDYSRRLDPWIEEFGIDAFDAFCVNRRGDEMDGVRSVIDVLQKRTGKVIDPDELDRWRRPDGSEAYVSPRAELIEGVRLLNSVKKPSGAYRRELAWLLEKWNDVEDLHDDPLMTAEVGEKIRAQMFPGYVELLQRFGLEDPLIDEPYFGGRPRRQSVQEGASRISTSVMQDVMRLARKLPNRDPIEHFFKRYRKQGFPDLAAQLGEKERKRVIERLAAAVFIKPVLAVWNIAPRDTKERLRGRAKAIFGSLYVDRIVEFARKVNPQQGTGK